MFKKYEEFLSLFFCFSVVELSNFYREIYSRHPLINEFCQWCTAGEKISSVYSLSGLQTSARALFLANVYEQLKNVFVVVCDDEESAVYFYNDLKKILSDTYFFPPVKKNDASTTILRTEVLDLFVTKKKCFVVTTLDALREKVPSQKTLSVNTFSLREGDTLELDFLQETLVTYGFEQVDFVYEPGQYSLRGSIVDVFSFTSNYPFRIDFFGNIIESIRIFDIEKQLSIDRVEDVTIVSDLNGEQEENKVAIFELLDNQKTIFFVNNLEQIKSNIEVSEEYVQLVDLLNQYLLVEFKKTVSNKFKILPQPLFHKNFELISDNLKQLQDDEFRIFIASDSSKQTDRIASIFEDRNDGIIFTPIKNTLHEGFVDYDLKICFYTDHQIFDRFHKYNIKTEHLKSGKSALMLKELNQIQIGDYIVHIDHGIGKFGGLQKLDVNGKEQEVIKLIYKNDDVIFVSIHGLHRISKYKGKDGEAPTINKLGTGAWERMKDRTKKKIKDIARDLIKLYAQRLKEKGFAFSPDTYLQQELEASFVYEDTPDQQKVTADIKHDMESEIPMDRLVCGDVGFGKTEIAIRAAFKAVTDNKQVAVLVPTTVLAFQHYKTFSERLKNFPCRIDYISRLRKSADVKKVITDTSLGKIDILIGTHRLIGKDIVFKDLGLLIIDEEQKFGVSVKEKLKQIKVNVDTLTLTATPIPRTLQFSLMGARDLSVITTAPPNRYPITTEICVFDEAIIKNAIQNELDRNGQVFFIHNRVQTIERVKQMLQRLIPDLRVAIAHGQMPVEELEGTLLDFIDYEYDVLVATTVVESGIDIPNVNTIIINNAQSFGLTDLHQLRGRVGRSNRKAYCYLLSPPFNLLTEEARRRLQAIESFSELGSGFNIAMQDLDIRGAGNMLGAEQSGFIADVGYETYQKILDEAVLELQNEEFSDLKPNVRREFVSDCFVESDLELLFPDNYIENVAERITLYRELDNINNEEDLNAFIRRLEDRFGALPKPAENLIQMLQLRWLAKSLGFERLILKKGQMLLYFVENKEAYYQSEIFGKVLQFIASNPCSCKLREQNNKRSILIQDVRTVSTAYQLLKNIL